MFTPLRIVYVLCALCPVQAFDSVFPIRRDSLGPFLYVGSHKDVMNTDSLRLLRIRYILLIGKREAGLKVLDVRRDHATYEYLEATDGLELAHFRSAWKFLNESMDKAVEEQLPGSNIAAANVLIVSARGCQRAGAVASSFLLRRLKMTPMDAMKHVESQRPCFKSTPRLMAMLEKMDEVTKVATTGEEIASELLKDVGRKVSSRSLIAQNLESCDPIHDTYWYYGDIPSDDGADFLPANSTQRCCELCDLHPRCQYWSYGLASEHRERCFLKSGDGTYMASRPHFVSGKRGAKRVEL